jgi:hypothetical protein
VIEFAAGHMTHSLAQVRRRSEATRGSPQTACQGVRAFEDYVAAAPAARFVLPDV